MRPPRALPPQSDRARSDGGFGRSESDGLLTGVWGAAWWDAGVDPGLPPTDTAAGICPDPSSNNIAEFYGFRATLRRALGHRPPRIVFELDSLLIVMMMQGRWGCHRAHLRVLLAECYDLSEALTRAGCEWDIRHIYREYNEVADNLAGLCLADPAHAHAWRSGWALLEPDESTNASGSEPSCESTPP